MSRRARQNVLAGDFIFRVFDFLAERQQGEKFVSTGNATECGNAQNSPEGGAKALRKFGRDALQFEISANRTMGA